MTQSVCHADGRGTAVIERSSPLADDLPVRVLGWLGSITLVLSGEAAAQRSGSGVVSGVVVDATGGVLPGADVELLVVSPTSEEATAPRRVVSDLRRQPSPDSQRVLAVATPRPALILRRGASRCASAPSPRGRKGQPRGVSGAEHMSRCARPSLRPRGADEMSVAGVESTWRDAE